MKHHLFVMQGLGKKIIAWLSKTGTIFLLIITFLGAGLRLHNLDGQGIWLDEMVTLLSSSGEGDQFLAPKYEGESIDVETFRRDFTKPVSVRPFKIIRDTFDNEPSHPPLYYMITNIFLSALGVSDFSVRLPSVLFGTLTIPFLFLLGRRLHSEEMGLVAAGIFATAPYQIYYGQEARMYAMVLFIAVVSTWLLVELSSRRREGSSWIGWPRWMAYAICLTAGIYTHYFFIFIVGIHLLYVAMSHIRDRMFLAYWCVAVIGPAMLFLPWVLARMFQNDAPRSGVDWLYGALNITQLIKSALSGVRGFIWVGELRPYKFNWIWAILLVFGLIASRRPRPLWLLPVWLVFPPIAAVCIDLLLDTHISLYDRYYLLSSGALYLLVALGIVTVRPWFLARILATLVIVYLAIGGYWTAQGWIRPRVEFKEAGQRIVRETGKSDIVVMVSSLPKITAMMLAHYMDRPGMIVEISGTDLEKLNVISQLDQHKPYDRLIVVVSELKGVNHREFKPQTVTSKLPFLEFDGAWNYRGLSIYRYRRPLKGSL